MASVESKPYRGCCGRQSPRRPRPLAPEKPAGARLLAFFAGGGRGHPCPDWPLNTLTKCGQPWPLSLGSGRGAAEPAAARVEGSTRRTCGRACGRAEPSAVPDPLALLRIVSISRASPQNLCGPAEQSLPFRGIGQPLDSIPRPWTNE